MTDPIARRRRGAVLEKAILEAAWEEVLAVGYAHFTYEGVIKRVGTSRSVLYRRWPTKLQLVMAAAHHFQKAHPIVVPDLGNVRDELYAALRLYADRAPPEAARLIFEMDRDLKAASESFASERFSDNFLDAPLNRGVARGEIDPAKLTPRILWVPVAIVLAELTFFSKTPSDTAIAEIVDQVFLPLVRPNPPA